MSQSKSLRPLSPRESRFVDEYIVSDNATQAYKAAGYSPKSADHAAHRVVARPCVKAEIDRRRAVLATAAQLKREDILYELLGAVALAKDKKDPHAIVKACSAVNKMMGWDAPAQIAVSRADLSHLNTLPLIELTRMAGLEPDPIDTQFQVLSGAGED